MKRDDFVAAVYHRAGELVADVDAEPSARHQYPPAFPPDAGQVQEILVQGLPIANLARHSVVFQVPVRRRSDHQTDGLVGQLRHIAAIADDDLAPDGHLCCASGPDSMLLIYASFLPIAQVGHERRFPEPPDLRAGQKVV